MEFLKRVTVGQLLILLVLLNLIDAASTHALLDLGAAQELNPLLRWAFNVTPILFWIIKMGLVATGATFFLKVPTERTERSKVILAYLNIFYVVVVASHIPGWVQYFAT